MKIVSFSIFKGGTGKTTSAVNTAAGTYSPTQVWTRRRRRAGTGVVIEVESGKVRILAGLAGWRGEQAW